MGYRRAAAACGALLAMKLAGCGSGEIDPAQAVAMATGADLVETAPAPTAAPAPPPIVKAPSDSEISKLCPLGAGISFDVLRGMLERGEFSALDVEIQRTQDAYRETPACEHYLVNAFEFLQSLDFAALDRWAAARPESWAALTARGSKWVATGYQRRGTKFAKDVTQDQWAGMNEAFEHADRDLRRAIEIEPDGFMAYAAAIQRLRGAGGQAAWRPWLDALLARDPANFTVRAHAVYALTPNWGGSIEQMREFVEDAQRYADRNPRLRRLLGEVDAEIARSHCAAKRHTEAAAAYRRALAYADVFGWYDGLASCLSRAGDWKAVHELADQWIAALDHAEAHIWRGRARVALGRPTEALADYDTAVEHAPRYAYALRRRAGLRRELGQLAGAASDLKRALDLEPDAWSMNLLAEVAAADAESAPSTVALARRLVKDDPNDRAAWYLLGSALSSTGAADARAALERYVALAESDGEEWARLARARRILNPPPSGGRMLPALRYVGLAPAKS